MSSDKALWLKRLGALDQEHAPDLPPHISPNDLPWQELRNLVERAQRRHRNSTGPAPLRPTRKTTIRIKPAIDVSRDLPSVLTVDTELLPGCALLLVHLENDLQCWTVPGGERVWSHRDDAPYETKGMRVLRFAYDMQTNGDVHVLVVTESFDELDRGRAVAIFQISPGKKRDCQSGTSMLGKLIKKLQIFPPLIKTDEFLYNDAPKGLESTKGIPLVQFAKLSGDVWAVSTTDSLLVTFWREDHSFLIRGCYCFCNDVHFVDGYLIGVFGDSKDRSIIAFRLSSIRNVRPRASSPGATQELALRDIPHSSCRIPHMLGDCWTTTVTTKLSICTFHWKPKEERKGISITAFVPIERNGRSLFMLVSFLLKTPAVTAGLNAGLPSITHRLGCIDLDPQIGEFNFANPPSQAGLVAIQYEHYREAGSMLATVSCEGEVKYRTLDMPYAPGLKVEFYSGALYFATVDNKYIVIQYLD